MSVCSGRGGSSIGVTAFFRVFVTDDWALMFSICISEAMVGRVWPFDTWRSFPLALSRPEVARIPASRAGKICFGVPSWGALLRTTWTVVAA